MHCIKYDHLKMVQRPYCWGCTHGRDFSKRLFMTPCLHAHFFFKAGFSAAFLLLSVAGCPYWLQCREALVAASHCVTIAVVAFHLGTADPKTHSCSVTVPACGFSFSFMFLFLEVDLQYYNCIVTTCFGILLQWVFIQIYRFMWDCFSHNWSLN